MIGELTNSADNTDDELNDHHDIANRVTHSMSVVQPSPLQNNVSMDVLVSTIAKTVCYFVIDSNGKLE